MYTVGLTLKHHFRWGKKRQLLRYSVAKTPNKLSLSPKPFCLHVCSQIYQSDQMKENEMDGTNTTNRRHEICVYNFRIQTPREETAWET
jgi:hypothetical protein